MPSKKISFLVLMSLLFIAVISSANSAGAAVEWTPLVRIPGLPATGTVNLSMYLIGLYNFMLSVVGIVAVIMLIIGGMRYITAVGNPTAISDAKDIINNAIVGLILALLSWVFISAINPDVLYIKQPGSGITDPSLAVKNMADCVANPCNFTDNNCIAPGSPISADSPNYKTEPYNSKCRCINQVFMPISAATCQDTCAPANCLVADVKIGLDQRNTGLTQVEIARRYAIYDSSQENPMICADGAQMILFAGNSVSGNPVAWWHWDLDGDNGVFSLSIIGSADPWSWAIADYAYYVGRAGCVITPGSPGFITCPLVLRVEDNTGKTSEDRVFIRIFKP